jgi:hypothetical protein
MPNRMIFPVATAAVALLAWSVLDAQTPPAAAAARPPEPATKFESFAARGNNLFVKEFHPVGELKGSHGTRAEFEAVAISSASDNSRVFAVRVERPSAGQYENDETGVIDFDEVVALAGAIDLMIGKAKEMGSAPVDYTEVEYTTRGGLSVGFFQKGTEQTAIIKVTKYSSHGTVYFGTERLSELRAIVAAAADKLKALGAR